MAAKKASTRRKTTAKKAPAGRSRSAVPAEVQKALDKGPPRGRVKTVKFLDQGGRTVRTWSSRQVPKDPFGGKKAYIDSGLVQPPFPMEQLQWLKESHTTHGACVDQRAVDTVGAYEWKSLMKPAEGGDPTAELKQWQEQFDQLGDDEMVKEILLKAQTDKETLGWGLVELARDTQQKVRAVYHVPGHTVRAHSDGRRLVQIRGAERVWFSVWGTNTVIDVNGKFCTDDDPKRANDIMVFRTASSRSDYYGIPNYISALGWIMLALAARDFNLKFFKNLREPRWAIIVTNLAASDEDDEEDDIEQSFAIDLREPHRNLLLEFEGDAKIDFQKLSEDQNDSSFGGLDDRCTNHVLIAHRMPADRIGITRVGPLGGNIVEGSVTNYAKAVIDPVQELTAHRWNRFIREELTEGKPQWAIRFTPVDFGSTKEDIEQGALMWTKGFAMLQEARDQAGLGALPEEQKDNAMKFIWQLPEAQAAIQAAMALDSGSTAARGLDERDVAAALQPLNEAIEQRLEGVNAHLREVKRIAVEAAEAAEA